MSLEITENSPKTIKFDYAQHNSIKEKLGYDINPKIN